MGRFNAFQQTPLQTFWPIVVFAIAIPEIYSVFSFQEAGKNEPWTIRSDHEAGDLGFDPLGLSCPWEALSAQSQIVRARRCKFNRGPY